MLMASAQGLYPCYNFSLAPPANGSTAGTCDKQVCTANVDKASIINHHACMHCEQCLRPRSRGADWCISQLRV